MRNPIKKISENLAPKIFDGSDIENEERRDGIIFITAQLDAYTNFLLSWSGFGTHVLFGIAEHKLNRPRK